MRAVASGAVLPEVAEVEDRELTFEYMLAHGVRALDVAAAGLGPLALKQRPVLSIFSKDWVL